MCLSGGGGGIGWGHLLVHKQQARRAVRTGSRSTFSEEGWEGQVQSDSLHEEKISPKKTRKRSRRSWSPWNAEHRVTER